MEETNEKKGEELQELKIVITDLKAQREHKINT